MDIFELAKNLKSARIAAQLTQADLAERTGVSLSTISALERGSAGDIGVAKLEQLLNATGFELTVKPKGQRRTLDDIAGGRYATHNRPFKITGRIDDLLAIPAEEHKLVSGQRGKSHSSASALFRAKHNPDHAVDLTLRQRVRKSGKKGNSK
jgi:transcriptional regulator with XRE-family HTH domain